MKNRPDVDKLIANVPDDSPQQGINIYSLNLKYGTHNFSIYLVDKKDEIKEIKSDKKKKSESGTDEPPPKKSKINDEGNIIPIFQRQFNK